LRTVLGRELKLLLLLSVNQPVLHSYCR